MAEELGRIEKPEAGEYAVLRKLYFVPLAGISPDADKEYIERFEKYWVQVAEQLANLELKLGQAKKLFHEFITEGGEKGSMMLEQLNPKSAAIIKEHLDKGASLEAIEDEAALGEFMDWSRCLSVGLQSEPVVNVVIRGYNESGKKRNEHLAKRIDQSLAPGEGGILFMREGHQLQFARDIQIIYVAPPALDELKRWLREQREKET